MKKIVISLIVIILAALVLFVLYPLRGSGALTFLRQELNLQEAFQESEQISPLAPTISYQGVEGKNALELLKQHYSIQSKDYGHDLGEFVEAIDGITPQKDEFWALFVNSKSSMVGASSYITKNGDVIEWRIQKISSAN
ncbi:MAG: DUF4430 domain-containing protein [Candidatus Spechtbacteria bacterium]|nr:DUF4430 domain-containing protein [Candidatus Spechtbacteria bacterium]